MKVEYINPFIVSTTNVFQTMLNCAIQRNALFLKENHCPEHPISGIIGLSGRASGMVVLGMSREAALGAAQAMLGYRPPGIDAEVKDLVGELVNMVAGAAKAQLEQFEMSLTIPTVVTGRFSVEFPSSARPIGVSFFSAWGELTLEVGLVEGETNPVGSPRIVTANSA